MTVRSQNCYTANDRSVIRSYTIPGTRTRVALRMGDPSVVLLEFARRWHLEVEPIDGAVDDWGYAERLIRGSSTVVSNHASGTAIDLNALRHALGRRGTLSPRQVAAVHRILADLEGAVRWGGDYTGRVDEMHGEIVDAAACARVAAKLRARDAGHAPASTAPSPTPPLGGPIPMRFDTMRQLQRGDHGPDVLLLQAAVVYEHARVSGDPAPVIDPVDGDFGEQTEAWVRAVQTGHGLPVDGVAGPQTWAALSAVAST